MVNILTLLGGPQPKSGLYKTLNCKIIRLQEPQTEVRLKG